MLVLKFPTVLLLESVTAFPYISKVKYGFLNIGLKLYIFQTMLKKLIICYITCRPLVKLTGHHKLETSFTLMGLVVFGKNQNVDNENIFIRMFSRLILYKEFKTSFNYQIYLDIVNLRKTRNALASF